MLTTIQPTLAYQQRPGGYRPGPVVRSVPGPYARPPMVGYRPHVVPGYYRPGYRPYPVRPYPYARYARPYYPPTAYPPPVVYGTGPVYGDPAYGGDGSGAAAAAIMLGIMGAALAAGAASQY